MEDVTLAAQRGRKISEYQFILRLEENAFGRALLLIFCFNEKQCNNCVFLFLLKTRMFSK